MTRSPLGVAGTESAAGGTRDVHSFMATSESARAGTVAAPRGMVLLPSRVIDSATLPRCVVALVIVDRYSYMRTSRPRLRRCEALPANFTASHDRHPPETPRHDVDDGADQPSN